MTPSPDTLRKIDEHTAQATDAIIDVMYAPPVEEPTYVRWHKVGGGDYTNRFPTRDAAVGFAEDRAKDGYRVCIGPLSFIREDLEANPIEAQQAENGGAS